MIKDIMNESDISGLKINFQKSKIPEQNKATISSSFIGEASLEKSMHLDRVFLYDFSCYVGGWKQKIWEVMLKLLAEFSVIGSNYLLMQGNWILNVSFIHVASVPCLKWLAYSSRLSSLCYLD